MARIICGGMSATDGMEIILFIYGFSFLALSAVVVFCRRKEEQLVLTRAFPWLAAFAFVHGALEWMELWRAARGDSPLFAWTRTAILLASYVLLFEFGRRLITSSRNGGQPQGRLAGLLLDGRIHAVLLAGTIAGSACPGDPVLNLAVWSRYLFGATGSALAGIGFINFASSRLGYDGSERSHPQLTAACLIAGLAFLSYGVFGGLVVPRTGWPPAAWINQESFQAAFGAPVQMFRAACAALIALSLGAVIFWNAKLKEKIWLLTSAVIAFIVAVDLLVGYQSIETTIRSELLRDAKDVRGMLMATRRVYHQQFLASGLPVDDKTIGFLPAHALSRISRDFPNWTSSGLTFNNVSDRPRNPANRADQFELDAMAFFRSNPAAEERLLEIHDTGKASEHLYHYTAPIWTEAYCLKCHGARESAPPSVAQNYASAYGYRVGDLRGVMSIKLPVTPLRHRAYSEWFIQFSMRLAGYTLLALTLVVFLNRVVVDRLAKLKQAATHIAAGDYSARSETAGDDEVGDLARAFNAMGQQIQQRDDHIRKLFGDRLQAINELRENQQNLEQIVMERTNALSERAEELQAANAQLESFSYSVSHDLRAPLRALNGYARILHEDEAGHLTAEGRQMLERIWQNSNRMGRLIDDILQFSRISRVEMNWTKTDMTSLARTVADEMRSEFPETVVHIADLPSANGDTSMLRQVWVNLIGNALKFSAKRPHPEVWIDAYDENNETVYRIRDNGAGFDMAYAEKLFGVFQRMHSESEFPGTGAGLAIVKHIIDRHGGRIWSEAKPDAGATFYFTLGG